MTARDFEPPRSQPKAWATPRVRKLRAGAAEFQQTNGSDGFTANS
jgi:hypothetical protein